jgi:hypothetical protein
MLKKFMIKKITFMISIVILMLMSMFFFFEKAFISAFLVWLYVPIGRFIMIGSSKNRLINSLGVLVLLVYLILSFYTWNFEQFQLMFFLVPFGSLLLKPKKHWLQYTTLGISILYLTSKYIFLIDMPFYVKWLLILIIEIVFLPGVIKKNISNYLLKLKQKMNSQSKEQKEE